MKITYLLWLAPILFIPSAFAQDVIVNVTESTPCFLNETAGYDMWRNCGYDQDYLKAALLPWEWITGGWFSVVIVSIFILITYIKYQKVIYPIIVGLLFLPISYQLFPQTFIWFAMGMVGFAIAILIWKTYIKTTKEY